MQCLNKPTNKKDQYARADDARVAAQVNEFRDLHEQLFASIAGGRKGDELFYEANNTLMGVSVETGDNFVPGQTRALFETPEGVSFFGFDISPDGRRFLAVRQVPGQAPRTAIVVVQNWLAEFEKR